jgi:hypothetical protein
LPHADIAHASSSSHIPVDAQETTYPQQVFAMQLSHAVDRGRPSAARHAETTSFGIGMRGSTTTTGGGVGFPAPVVPPGHSAACVRAHAWDSTQRPATQDVASQPGPFEHGQQVGAQSDGETHASPSTRAALQSSEVGEQPA